ncbi:hypothetical protein BDN72DRAFT_929663 [Pluteus cervinus]|uniref:Uncharacterized protein n=1 Tax=Pluteus cervinus TaxID=181527 RepID=A0ACD3AC41_9AGAR|nr:hypothetical protein BDN72DRAFT_929663 [Pluteus cervinus]
MPSRTKELDQEQPAIVEKGLGLMGMWHGETDWYGSQVQRPARVVKDGKGYRTLSSLRPLSWIKTHTSTPRPDDLVNRGGKCIFYGDKRKLRIGLLRIGLAINIVILLLVTSRPSANGQHASGFRTRYTTLNLLMNMLTILALTQAEEILTDRCSFMNIAMAMEIRRVMTYTSIPTAVQGRIAGAKTLDTPPYE